jgi:hypothetical protein
MKFTDLVSYFENIAAKHKLIQHADNNRHFFRINLDELITGFKQDLQFPAIMLELPESRVSGATLDNLFMSRYVGLSFLDKVDAGDIEGELNCYDRMEALGLDYLSRVRRDYQDFNNRFVAQFDWNDIRVYKVGPIHHNCYGMRFEITVGSSSSGVMHYNTENWID